MTDLVSFRRVWLEPGPLSGAATDTAWLFLPHQAPTTGSPLVIYCHGVGTWPNPWPTVPDPVSTRLETIGKMTNAGATVLMPAIGDPTVSSGTTSINSWGSAIATARVEAWRVWAAANIPGVLATKIGLMGDSMGNMTATSYARDYRSKVTVIASYSPLADCKWFRENVSGFKASIDAAWGLLSGDPTPAAMDQLSTPELVGLPWRGYYLSDDAVVPPSSAVALAQWTGGQAICVGTGGHEYNQWASSQVNWQDFRNFFLPLLGL